MGSLNGKLKSIALLVSDIDCGCVSFCCDRVGIPGGEDGVDDNDDVPLGVLGNCAVVLILLLLVDGSLFG